MWGVYLLFPLDLCVDVTLGDCSADHSCHGILIRLHLTVQGPAISHAAEDIARTLCHNRATFHTPPAMTEMTGPTVLSASLISTLYFPTILIFQSMTGECRPAYSSLAPHPWLPPCPLLTEMVQALETKG